MFDSSHIRNVANAASALQRGKGDGYTEYAHKARYVVGGLTPSVIIPTGVLTPNEWRALLQAFLEVVGTARFTAQTLGVWEDNGLVYADLGTVTDDLSHAMGLGVLRGEKAIYDSQEGVCIPVAAPEQVS